MEEVLKIMRLVLEINEMENLLGEPVDILFAIINRRAGPVCIKCMG
jgi:hypothetical protein